MISNPKILKISVFNFIVMPVANLKWVLSKKERASLGYCHQHRLLANFFLIISDARTGNCGTCVNNLLQL